MRRRSRHSAGVGLLVVNGCERIWLVGWFRAFPGADGRPHPNGISWLAVGCHHYIGTLASLDRE